MNWFGWKKNKPDDSSNKSYEGKPLLFVLENYALDCIGHLPEQKRAAMIILTQKVYGGGDDWKANVRQTLHLGETLDDSIKSLWNKNLEIAAKNGLILTPENFAKMFVIENFASRFD